MKENLLVLCFLLLGCLPLTGQIPPQSGSGTQLETEDQLVHFGDIIDVDVVGGFEYDWRGTITPEGYLEGLDAFDGPIPAICRSESQIAASVAKALSKTLREPKVIVKIIDRSNRAVARLDGAVRTPTRFKLQRTVHLRELIVLAGGFTDNVSGEIRVLRPGNMSCLAPADTSSTIASAKDNGLHVFTIKITDLLKGETSSNMQILSGDSIEVTKAEPIYVIGAVNSPKPIYIRAETTISRAIAISGGLAKDADGGKVSIFRREGSETSIIETDLSKIKRGESVDVVLKPFDILDVAGKGGGKRKYPPLEATSGQAAIERRELPLRVID